MAMTSNLPGLAVEIDDLAERQPPVAPRRVDVEVAEQERLVSRHQILTSRCVVSFGRWCSSSDAKFRT